MAMGVGVGVVTVKGALARTGPALASTVCSPGVASDGTKKEADSVPVALDVPEAMDGPVPSHLTWKFVLAGKPEPVIVTNVSTGPEMGSRLMFGVGAGVLVGVAVDVGVAVGVDVLVSVAIAVGVGVVVSVWVAVGVLVAVAGGMSVAVAVGVFVGVGVLVSVGVAVGGPACLKVAIWPRQLPEAPASAVVEKVPMVLTIRSAPP